MVPGRAMLRAVARKQRMHARIISAAIPSSIAATFGNICGPYHRTGETSGPRYILKCLHFSPQLIFYSLFQNLRLIVYFVRNKKRLIVYCLFWQNAINC
jgi:hypothetical protein